MYKNLFKLFFLFAIVIGFTTISFGQNSNDMSNNPYSLRLVRPLAWNQGAEPDVVVVSNGPFDNYRVSSNSGFAETDIQASMIDPLNFVATDNRITGYSGPRYIYYTTDGGVTWNSTTSGITSNYGDPAFASDSLGNFYLSVLNSAGVQVFKSADKGATWTNLGNVLINSSSDKEWVWCDQTNSTYKNNVYVAYVNFATGGGVDLWRSTNSGSSWTGPFVIAAGNQGANPGPNMTVTPSGRLVLAWNTSSGASVRYSDDGGASFGTTINAAQYVQPGTYNSTSGRYCVKGNIRTNGHPQLACDLSNGPYKGYVYLQYATNPPGPDAADIFVAKSTDGGATWGIPVKINDDATYTDQWMGDVSVDRQGRVWVMWWDSRNDPTNNILTETYGAVSTDGGVTYTNFKISNQNFNPNIIKIYQGTEHYYLGDYQGISGSNNTFPFYTGQGNTLQDYTAYLPDYGISFQRPIDTVNQGQTSVNRVIAPMMGPYSGTVSYSASVSPNPSQGTITFNWSPSNVKTFTGAPDSITLNTVVSATVPYQNYTISVTAAENGGQRTHTRTWILTIADIIGISNNNNEVPLSYALGQNYPNPFNPATQIEYTIPKQSFVSIKVYNLLGQDVATLVNSVKQAGVHDVTFNASELPSGIYYYRMNAGNYSDVRKMILVK
jgi:hypothetical protein